MKAISCLSVKNIRTNQYFTIYCRNINAQNRYTIDYNNYPYTLLLIIKIRKK